MEDVFQKFIAHIERLQSRGDRFFPAGMFRSERVNPLLGYRRKDTNIFYSAIICFTLRSIRTSLPPEMQARIDQICEKVIASYPLFQNKDGLKTYNFWQTKPSQHFPNGFIFKRFLHFKIPDDVDDTTFIYLTSDPSEEEQHWLKNKLSLHANGARQKIRNTYPEYHSLPAYSTWFGKNMYIEFDVSVLSNLMYAILHFGLPLNEHDHASLAYIRSTIETGRYVTVPFRCAHQYPRSPLIVYHVARLISAFDPPALRPVRAKLIEDTQELLDGASHVMDRVILSTSLMRFGVPAKRIAVEQLGPEDFRGFYFFIAGLLTAYEHPLLYRLASVPLFHMYWICEAHCWTLLAEYETLWQANHPN